MQQIRREEERQQRKKDDEDYFNRKYALLEMQSDSSLEFDEYDRNDIASEQQEVQHWLQTHEKLKKTCKWIDELSKDGPSMSSTNVLHQRDNNVSNIMEEAVPTSTYPVINPTPLSQPTLEPSSQSKQKVTVISPNTSSSGLQQIQPKGPEQSQPSNGPQRIQQPNGPQRNQPPNGPLHGQRLSNKSNGRTTNQLVKQPSQYATQTQVSQGVSSSQLNYTQTSSNGAMNNQHEPPCQVIQQQRSLHKIQRIMMIRSL